MQAAYQDRRVVPHKAHLVDTIVRNRVKDSIFYKQHLYLTNEATVLPVIAKFVDCVAGLDAGNRPAPFLCCLVRLLEVDPPEAVVQMYLEQQEFPYLTALALAFVRFTYSGAQVYRVLDGFVTSYVEMRQMLRTPEFEDGIAVNYRPLYMDEVVDQLVHNERFVDVLLPALEDRETLVARGLVGERVWLVKSLGEEAEEEEKEEEYESDSD